MPHIRPDDHVEVGVAPARAGQDTGRPSSRFPCALAGGFHDAGKAAREHGLTVAGDEIADRLCRFVLLR
ncbi:hypothetical protein ABH15_02920 [Methanoculleus taiwanensis]|uniref:Uncharacterized protein n=1 Tax=Methanoculleus taiwanensis TaxID=1550565 RepID=A0A498H4K4_9EURY|nr:hypothetical protein ABH15_02920 [Methanoculleus taiwanensis]